jgi:hypothetical protein
METVVKKKSGFGDYLPGRVDEVRNTLNFDDDSLDQTIERFFTFHSDFQGIIDSIFNTEKTKSLQAFVHEPDEVLHPAQIQYIAKRVQENLKDSIMNFSPGQLLTRLIQSSYNGGHNGFYLGLKKPLNHIGVFLQGSEKNPLKITIEGPVGDFCGAHTVYCIFSLQNTGEHCGSFSKRSKFTLQSAGESCGVSAFDSTFIIKGNAEKYLGGGADYSRFSVEGDVDHYTGYFAENCEFLLQGDGPKFLYDFQFQPGSDNIFKVARQETYELLCSEASRDNSIIRLKKE